MLSIRMLITECVSANEKKASGPLVRYVSAAHHLKDFWKKIQKVQKNAYLCSMITGMLCLAMNTRSINWLVVSLFWHFRLLAEAEVRMLIN